MTEKQTNLNLSLLYTIANELRDIKNTLEKQAGDKPDTSDLDKAIFEDNCWLISKFKKD